jgi:hypothetical protein
MVPARFAVLLLLAAALAGCGHMPVTSMLALSRVDFATTDPAQLRAAVKLPRAVRPRTVAMRILVKLRGGHEEAQDFTLREVIDPRELLALHGKLDPDTHIYAYRFEAADLTRVQAFRAELLRKQGERRGGSLRIEVRPETCRVGDVSGQPLRFSSYVRTGETGDYVPLVVDLDVRTLKPDADVAALIPPCGDADR